MTLWGQARIEVLVVQDEIKSELTRGVPMKRIYNALTKANQITVSYNSFRRQILTLRKEINRTANSNKTTPIAAANAKIKSVPAQPEQSFNFNPTANVQDYFD